MSMELNEIRNKLDLFEKCINNPELLMSESFADEITKYSLFYNITKNGKSFFDYLVGYLYNISAFKNTKIRVESDKIFITIPSLDSINDLILYDKIIKIDIETHTYTVMNEGIDNYSKIMNMKYSFESYELNGFLKKFENYSIKKRFSTAYSCLHNKDKNIKVRLSDFLFCLFVSKRYISKILNKEYEKLNTSNKCLKKRYDENISLQKYYLEKAPEHIIKIKNKQDEIIKYLYKYHFKEQKR